MARIADDDPLIPLELPVADGDQPERADAQRNRLKVLTAAERLFASHGVENVSMDAIAAEAGVGKGTLFRRFGDRAGLALALLHEHTVILQERIIRGPAPLGPGAPPKEPRGQGANRHVYWRMAVCGSLVVSLHTAFPV